MTFATDWRVYSDAAGEITEGNGKPHKSSTTSTEAGPMIIKPITAGELLVNYPVLHPVVVEGILRRGEVCNIIATSKVGKSWLAYSLAFSIATGQPWLQAFECTAGRCLLIDNELHPPTLARRLDTVANAMGLDSSWHDSIDVLPLRGRAMDMNALGVIINAIEGGEYRLIIADAFYRFLPAGTDENSNGGMTQLYNLVDRYAEVMQAAWVNIHHSSKGDQSGKQVVDVGSGAGAMSRACDAHLVLRPHEQENVVVLEAAVRSFAPVQPLSLRWEYPLWQRDLAANPAQLKRPTTKQEAERAAKDDTDKRAIVAELAGGGKSITANKLNKLFGWNPSRAARLLHEMATAGELVFTEGLVNHKEALIYTLTEVDDWLPTQPS